MKNNKQKAEATPRTRHCQTDHGDARFPLFLNIYEVSLLVRIKSPGTRRFGQVLAYSWQHPSHSSTQKNYILTIFLVIGTRNIGQPLRQRYI